ncbi:MAG: DUF2092 domain-containing protein [Proteobacteria bacterium]|nr:DUF2092 domain-containing protein [Pseudomonadota bacterium]
MLKNMAGSFGLFVLLFSANPSHARDLSKISLQSDQALKSATDYIKSLNSFSYTAHTSVETVSSSNEKIMFDMDLKVAVKRPNKIFAQKTGYETMQFYFNGSRLVGFNPSNNRYAASDESGDIDSLLKVLSKYQVEAPMADFVSSDPYKVLFENIESADYLGTAEIAGGKYHHLAFRQDNVDWQLWIDMGPSPLIKRFRVTSKSLTGSPSYTVDLDNWKSNPDIDDSLFNFSIPDTASSVEFKDLRPL